MSFLQKATDEGMQSDALALNPATIQARLRVCSLTGRLPRLGYVSLSFVFGVALASLDSFH